MKSAVNIKGKKVLASAKIFVNLSKGFLAGFLAMEIKQGKQALRNLNACLEDCWGYFLNKLFLIAFIMVLELGT